MPRTELAGALALLLLLSGSCTRRAADPAPPPLEGPAVPDFTLLDHEGRAQALYREGGRKAVVIVGHVAGSRLLQEQAPALREMAVRLEEQGARFFLLNAKPSDSRARIISDAKEARYGLPILLDPSQGVAAELGLARAGEAVVLHPAKWQVAWRGPAGPLLGEAVEALVRGGKPPAPGPAAAGEAFPPIPAPPTFTKGVGEIFRAKCVGCHSEKGGYPPHFDSYETVKGWSAMIKETVLTEQMPPWSADPHYGPFANDISLSPGQKRDLLAWIRGGQPRGAGEDPLGARKPAAPARKLPEKVWELAMEKPQEIGPRGTVDYLFFQVGGPAPYDMWVTAVHTRSSNPRQLHHEGLMITSKPLAEYVGKVSKVRRPEEVAQHPDGDVPFFTMGVIKREEFRKDENYVRFLAYAAGREQPYFFPSKGAHFIPKGYYAILEVHYVGNGKEDREQTKIDLYGYRARGSLRRLRTLQVSTDRQFEIPPGERGFLVHTDPMRMKRDIEIVGLLGHLHMRGRSIKLYELSPDGRSRVIASVPNYNFNWQSGMPLTFKEPVKVKAGSRLKAVCEYDNSPYNPLNPDATRNVRHGQTLDRAEMCKYMITYFADEGSAVGSGSVAE